MANKNTLVPFTSDQSREEAVKNGRKGGIASGKKRKEIKSFREAAEWALGMTTKANVGGEQTTITQYQRIMLTLLGYLNDPDDAKLFMQAAQMLAQFRSSGYAEEKALAEIEKLRAETKRLKADTKEENTGRLAELIEGLKDDLHTETASADADVAGEQTETSESP